MARLLRQCPGDALCGACLAFDLKFPLEVARATMALLQADAAGYRRVVSRCASCLRTVDTIVWDAG